MANQKTMREYHVESSPSSKRRRLPGCRAPMACLGARHDWTRPAICSNSISTPPMPRPTASKCAELILTLAMQGKLQNRPSYQPASELLKSRRREKQRLVAKAGKIKPNPLPPIKLEKCLYELPEGVGGVRLGEIGVWKSGSTKQGR